MILVDLNLLLYAVNTGSPHHRKAKRWLEEVLSGDESVALPWVVLLGFLRITTNRHILDAHLAAIAIGHGCELCSTDSDFGRFDHLRWRNPIL